MPVKRVYRAREQVCSGSGRRATRRRFFFFKGGQRWPASQLFPRTGPTVTTEPTDVVVVASFSYFFPFFNFLGFYLFHTHTHTPGEPCTRENPLLMLAHHQAWQRKTKLLDKRIGARRRPPL